MNTCFTNFADLQFNKKIRFYKIFINTMYTGAAQADITTTAVNVIVVSRTTHFLKYIPGCTIYLWWRLIHFW